MSKFNKITIIRRFRKVTISALLIGCSVAYTPAFAADTADDIDSMIQSQQRILAQLTQKKSQKNSKEILNKIDFFLNKSRLIPAHSDYFRIILIFYGFFNPKQGVFGGVYPLIHQLIHIFPPTRWG